MLPSPDFSSSGEATSRAEPRLRFDVLTLFPSLFDSFVSESLIGRAVEAGRIAIHRWNIRDWARGRHQQVDDRPFGGGPGMVLMAPPVVEAVEAVRALDPEPGWLIALTPRGRRLDQQRVAQLAEQRRLILICGRYEGFDERIFEILRPELVSIGDYILSGGEVPAMVLIEAVSRLVPGVLGHEQSAQDESFDQTGSLEYPHYTRPREYRGLHVPEVLLGGDHAAIAAWRRSRRQLPPNPDTAVGPLADCSPHRNERPPIHAKPSA
ncbi:MAG: tRNA (guanine-N(1)-)-methyltransferase [Isosphaeraceae bacterium]|jgi:tRNA (guanine37-N1)-methyltransferase|nr:MAG: tRNA (guanine-N(1)-)-methyltransferase [Isosphaeraceae bacterium]